MCKIIIRRDHITYSTLVESKMSTDLHALIFWKQLKQTNYVPSSLLLMSLFISLIHKILRLVSMTSLVANSATNFQLLVAKLENFILWLRTIVIVFILQDPWALSFLLHCMEMVTAISSFLFVCLHEYKPL